MKSSKTTRWLSKPLALISVLFASFWSLPARADLDVKLVGAWSYARPISDPSTFYSPSLAQSYGILFDLPIIKTFKIDFGFLALPRSYTASGSTTEFTAYHFPAVGHYFLAPSFAVGLGGYYDLMATQGFSARGYGAVASVLYDYTIIPGVGWIFDGRYQYGLSDVDPSGTSSTHFTEWVGITGFRLGFSR